MEDQKPDHSLTKTEIQSRLNLQRTVLSQMTRIDGADAVANKPL